MLLRPRPAAVAALIMLFMLTMMLSRHRRRAYPKAVPSDDPAAFVYAYASGDAPYPMLSLAGRLSPACPGGPLSPPYVTVEWAGSLGSFVLEYMSAWALAREYQLPAFVPDRILRRLHVAFGNLSLPPASTLLRSDPECLRLATQEEDYPEVWEEWHPWGGKSLVDLNRISVEKAVAMARVDHSIIVLDESAMLAEAIVPLLGELREEMLIEPQLRSIAQDDLSTLRRLHLPDFEGEVVFCGMHVSRTDKESLSRLYGDVEPADSHYYLAGARWMRGQVHPAQALLFVVTSDDRNWVEGTLLPTLDMAAMAEEDVGGAGWAAVWAGSGVADGSYSDLALLAACNHTVFAYGPFALSAALLAGGKASAYQIAPTSGDRLLLTPSEQFARNVPGWVALR